MKKILNIGGIIVILFTIIGGTWQVSKLFSNIEVKLAGISSNIETISEDIDKINTGIYYIPDISNKVNVLWEEWKSKYSNSNSLTVLNENGINILKMSNIGEIIKPHLGEIIENLKIENIDGIFCVEKHIIYEFHALAKLPEVVQKMKIAQNESNTGLYSLLYIAALYYKDHILMELGFTKEDIDEHS